MSCWAPGSRRLPTSVEVAKAYDGVILSKTQLKGTHTKAQMAQAAIKVDISVIKVLGEIMNEEYPGATIKKKRVKDSAILFALDENEGRVVKKCFFIHALRSLSSFISESSLRYSVWHSI